MVLSSFSSHSRLARTFDFTQNSHSAKSNLIPQSSYGVLCRLISLKSRLNLTQNPKWYQNSLNSTGCIYMRTGAFSVCQFYCQSYFCCPDCPILTVIFKIKTLLNGLRKTQSFINRRLEISCFRSFNSSRK